jgi:hypothetical protein
MLRELRKHREQNLVQFLYWAQYMCTNFVPSVAVTRHSLVTPVGTKTVVYAKARHEREPCTEKREHDGHKKSGTCLPTPAAGAA